jgi:thiol-disulfide isomerase/thioredoxin
MDPVQIRFYTRKGCHLCKKSLTVLQELQKEFKFRVQLVDIDGSPRLLAAYGHDIPVGEMEGRKIFRHRIDKQAMREILRGRLKG